MRLLERIFYPPAPAQRLALVRLLVGLYAVAYLAIRSVDFTSAARLSHWEFEPVGAARLLSEPLPPALFVAALVALLALGVAFALGWRYRVTAPAFGLLLLCVTSYRNSWGMLFHTDNLLLLHVLVLAVAPAADAFSLDARRRGLTPREASGEYGWAIRVACVLTVLTYVLAGVAKLKLAGFDWLEGEQLRRQIAYDNLRKIELGHGASWLGVWFVRHRALFPPLALMTLLIELGAPFALSSRRIAFVWALAAWSFHLGVVALMNIGFPYPLSCVPFLAFFQLEKWLASALGQRLLSGLRGWRWGSRLP